VKHIVAILFVLASAMAAQAQDPRALFTEGVSAYQRGQFDSAATVFARLAQSGADDERVWYNLGNSLYKSGHVGAALVAYRRGMRLAPRDADLSANYRYVRLFAVDKIEPVGVLFLQRWWNAAVDKVSIFEARWAGAFLFWLAGAITVWRWWPTHTNGRWLPLWVVGCLWALWIMATAASATCYARDVARRDGFVATSQTNVRGGPGDEYALQFVAHDGLQGAVERTESGWYLVQFPNGLKGWLQANSFEII
jgi:tetratricopeptide (TPR) repeat protein